MSKEQRRIFGPIVVVLLAITGALVLVAARPRSAAERKASSHAMPEVKVVNSAQSPARPLADRVHRGRLWPQLRWNLAALGNRLEKPGKERLTLAGTFQRADEQTALFAAILEFPDRLRITTQPGSESRTIVFDGQGVRTVGGSLTSAEEGLIESLVYDTAEHFFTAQSAGVPTRHLGNHFRTDDGATENYAGPFYNVFSVLDLVKVTPETRSQSKFYCFNSETRLLEKVHYQTLRNGASVEVETRIDGWRSIEGEQVPSRIIRKENTQQVFVLTITSATLSPRISDGVF